LWPTALEVPGVTVQQIARFVPAIRLLIDLAPSILAEFRLVRALGGVDERARPFSRDSCGGKVCNLPNATGQVTNLRQQQENPPRWETIKNRIVHFLDRAEAVPPRQAGLQQRRGIRRLTASKAELAKIEVERGPKTRVADQVAGGPGIYRVMDVLTQLGGPGSTQLNRTH